MMSVSPKYLCLHFPAYHPQSSSYDGTSSCGPTGSGSRRFWWARPAVADLPVWWSRCECDGGGGGGGAAAIAASLGTGGLSSARSGSAEAAEEEPADVADVILVCLELNVPVDGVILSVLTLMLCSLYRRIRAVAASGGDLGHGGLFRVSVAGRALVSAVVSFV